MQHDKIKKELKQHWPVGTYYTVIRKNKYHQLRGGIIIDYKVNTSKEWKENRIKELEDQYPDYVIFAETLILGWSELRQKKTVLGEKRRKAGGHGYSGGDGYIEL